MRTCNPLTALPTRSRVVARWFTASGQGCANTKSALGQTPRRPGELSQPECTSGGTGPLVGHHDSGGRLPSSRHLIALVALALAGCAHQPLVTSCITPQQYEQLKASEPPKIKSRLHGKADEDIRIVTGSALELRSWGETLLDTLKICSEPKTTGATH